MFYFWKYAGNGGSSMQVPDWFRKANVYEIYPRVHRHKNNVLSTLVDIKADLPG